MSLWAGDQSEWIFSLGNCNTRANPISYNNGMKLKLSLGAVTIVRELEKAGYEAWIVGGAVRDVLLGEESNDWDITTSATPEQILPLLMESFNDNNFGTVMVAGKHVKEQFELDGESCSDDEIFDITTYRTEGSYSDKRRPDNVSWGKSIEEDLKRRDFTVNAIAISVSVNSVSSVKNSEYDVEIMDPYDGQNDLENKIIRAVGDPETRFEEDALRMMRAIRIGAQLGFSIEQETLSAIKKKASNLSEIAWERIGMEMMKLIGSQHAADGIQLMVSTDIAEVVLPELLESRGVKQAGHHIYDVYTHLIEALRACSSPDPVVRLSTLLHDIDKPVVMKKQGPRGVTFYNHEVSGARTAKRIAKRWRLSKNDQDRVFTLVRWHMFAYDPEMTDASIRRFIRRVGKENIHDMMALRTGDRVGGGSKATSWRLTELQRRIGEQFYEPLGLKDLKITGDEIMKILNVKPGRKIGEILNALFEEVIEDSKLNNKEYLEKRVRGLG